MNENYIFNVRVTGILIQENKILLVKQKIAPGREWSLPGGRVETGESLEQSMIREMKEETGLIVRCKKMLYLCEKSDLKPPILHVTFLLDYIGGTIELPTNEHDENPISDVKFVNISTLNEFGFTDRFKNLIVSEFPCSGSYMGDKKNIGL
jgi:ADP-ribose pyrophosphatase YjhB (NUDIX family)